MDYTKYFKSFDYKNNSKKGKSFPFVTNCAEYTNLIQYKYTIKDLKDIIKRMQLPKCNIKKRMKYNIFALIYYFYHLKYKKFKKYGEIIL